MRGAYSSSGCDTPSLRLRFVIISILRGNIPLLLSSGAPSSSHVRVVLGSFDVKGIRNLSIKLNMRVVVDRKKQVHRISRERYGGKRFERVRVALEFEDARGERFLVESKRRGPIEHGKHIVVHLGLEYHGMARHSLDVNRRESERFSIRQTTFATTGSCHGGVLLRGAPPRRG